MRALWPMSDLKPPFVKAQMAAVLPERRHFETAENAHRQNRFKASPRWQWPGAGNSNEFSLFWCNFQLPWHESTFCTISLSKSASIILGHLLKGTDMPKMSFSQNLFSGHFLLF